MNPPEFETTRLGVFDNECWSDEPAEVSNDDGSGSRDYGRIRVSRNTSKVVNARRARNKTAAKSRRAQNRK